ncbi:MAG TPA: phosphatase PAP2 family protein [Streptosporangiaceae bacterium]|nr:phosphatase PAP2 family protein [Streptosporangiaceae bacterium]
MQQGQDLVPASTVADAPDADSAGDASGEAGSPGDASGDPAAAGPRAALTGRAALTDPAAPTGQAAVTDPAALSPTAELGSARPRLAGALKSGQRLRSWAAKRRRSLIGWTVLALIFVVFVAIIGVPLSDDTVLLWLAAVLFVASLDNLKDWRTGVLRDWLPLYLVLFGYNLLRGYASHVLWGPFVRPQIAIDKFIGFGTVPTVTLQRWLFDPNHLHWWDYAAWTVYNSHFFVSYVIAAVLWKRNHQRFRRFINLYVVLTFVGYVGYLLYPAMPPWMASEAGHAVQGLGTPVPGYLSVPSGYQGATTRIIPVVWQHIGLKAAAALLTRGSEFYNNVAAMPSLHASYPLLILLFFWPRARWQIRVLLVSYVLAMAFTLVYTGEHFVTDELAGWACTITVFFVGSRLADRRLARRRARAVRAAAPDAEQLTEQPAACSPTQA